MKRLLVLFMSFVLVLASCGKAAIETDNTDGSDVTEVVATAEEPTGETEPVESEPSEQATVTDPTEPEVPTEKGSTPLLYKVTDDDSSVWLFGSIHVGREGFYPFPDYVNSAYEGSDAIAFECDITVAEENMLITVAMLRKMMLKDGTEISDHVSSEVYEKAKAYLIENNSYLDYFDMFMPCLWEQLVSQTLYMEAGADFDSGVDRYLLKRAKEDGKEIIDIEDLFEHITMPARYSMPLQTLLLEESVNLDIEELKPEIEGMLDVWASGDEDAIKEMVKEDTSELTEEEWPLYEEYKEILITERDALMTDFAVDALDEDKEIFICVGMAHIAGEEAMVYRLRNLGYTVEIVK